MKKLLLIGIACVGLLSGCAHFQDARLGLEGFNPRVIRQPQPLLPNVFVVNSRLVVDQEPIRISRREVGHDGRVTISWALAAGSPYTFANKGIEFPREPNKGKQPPELDCRVQGSARKIAECTFRPPVGRSEFKYTIYVQNPQNKSEVIEPLDPYVVSDI
ncbi:MAG: hypothetical protein ABJA83_00635 [Burkholderiaceae bacterium]